MMRAVTDWLGLTPIQPEAVLDTMARPGASGVHPASQADDDALAVYLTIHAATDLTLWNELRPACLRPAEG